MTLIYRRKKRQIDNEKSKRLKRGSIRFKSMQIYTTEIIRGIWDGSAERELKC